MKSLNRVDTVTYCDVCKKPYEPATTDYSDRVFCRTCLERAMNSAEIAAIAAPEGLNRMADVAHFAIKIYDKRRAKNGNR